MSFFTRDQDVQSIAKAGWQWKVQRLLESDCKAVISIYPWVDDLITESKDKADIALAIVEVENVRWRQHLPHASYEPYAWRKAPEDKDIDDKPDHTGEECAHNIAKTVGQHAAVSTPKLARPQTQPSVVTDKVATWEEIVFKNCGIGGVLHPSLTKDSLEPTLMSSNGGIVHILYTTDKQDAIEIRREYMRNNSLSGAMGLFESMMPTAFVGKLTQRWDSWQCLPLRIWIATRQFLVRWLRGRPEDIVRAGLSKTRSPVRSVIGNHRATHQAANAKIWDHDILKECIRALKSVLLAMKELNRTGGCCDTFSIFVRSSGRRRLSAIDIRFEDISELVAILKQPLVSATFSEGTEDISWRSRICTRLFDLCETIFGSRSDALDFFVMCTTEDDIMTFVLHLAALYAQLFSVGLATFCGGHCSSFYTSHISRHIEKINLVGVTCSGPRISAQRIQLSCLGEMLERPVWAFQLVGPELARWHFDVDTVVRAKHDVEARVSQLLDIWHTTLLTDHASVPNLVTVAMGNGFLYRVKPTWWPFSLIPTETMYHWGPQEDGTGLTTAELETDIKLVVGAVTENQNCPLTADACQSQLDARLINLRVRKGHWKVKSRSFNVNAGLGGGPMAPGNVGVAGGVVQEWYAETNLKGERVQSLATSSRILGNLNEPWGLEFSLCTGVARRVPLRALLDTTVIEYLQASLHAENLTQTLDTDLFKRIRNASSDDKASAIFEELKRKDLEQYKALQQVVVLLMEALQWSRLDKAKKSLLLWWPEPTRAAIRGLALDKTWYADEPWIPILEDTLNGALFGLATARCLEDSRTGKLCQNAGGANKTRRLCKSTDFVLHTGIGPYQKRLAIPPQGYLAFSSREDRNHVFKVRQVATFEEDAYVLEYRGVWPKPAMWLMGVEMVMKVENADMIASDDGKEVIICQKGYGQPAPSNESRS
ncbi:uncharacterized protein HMPREF1541_04015 [Cyphellophora europaea CBS 101466]|uniref:Uncharacterized protein n=1 Tax=Cyphellophora europaea (strain CBS 101466) TaxID=1220924 RepID=W2S013_CYPE1|nr:uncharacterized protein HMPREF1541_04015 [Cyphellophora europaea CBS 101466]ETN42076.1 hypothetical protein HMPREF1541_04015 [Cyphellophora europaea CBS 101466]